MGTIDYLDGTPTVTPKPVKTSENPEEMLRFDLERSETIEISSDIGMTSGIKLVGSDVRIKPCSTISTSLPSLAPRAGLAFGNQVADMKRGPTPMFEDQ